MRPDLRELSSDKDGQSSALTLAERIAAAPWRLTKKMNPPHEYVMSHFTEDMPQFIIDVETEIILNGYDGRFFRAKKVYRYWEPGDGFRYWVMPHPTRITLEMMAVEPYVLNRQLVSHA